MELISVIVPVYNAIDYLSSSIFSIANQPEVNIEIIAINDGSTDGSGDLLDKLAENDDRIRVYHQKNKGLGKTIKRGIGLAKGKYIARQDADDISASSRLLKQYLFMEENKEICLSGTWVSFFTDISNPIYYYCPPNDHDILCKMLKKKSNPFVHGSIMFKYNDYKMIGEGMRELLLGEDFDLWLRLSKIGKIGCLESIEYFYRINPNGTMSKYGSVSGKVKKNIVKLNRLPANKQSVKCVNKLVECKEHSEAVDTIEHTKRIVCLLNKDYKEYRMLTREEGSKNKIKYIFRNFLFKITFIAKMYYKIRTRYSNIRYLKLPSCVKDKE
jgi:glycosyltransferase involved in cell wall biosynthesis